MLPLNHNLSEAGYIAEELMQTDELIRKCKVIKLTLEDGDFTLDEALQVYQVSREDYLRFTAANILKDFYTTISTVSDKSGAMASVELFEILYKSLMNNVDDRLPQIIRHFKKLSTDIKADKISVAHFKSPVEHLLETD